MSDYSNIKESILELLPEHCTAVTIIGKQSAARKYVYEIGLKCTPKRKFSTRKIHAFRILITRIN